MKQESSFRKVPMLIDNESKFLNVCDTVLEVKAAECF